MREQVQRLKTVEQEMLKRRGHVRGNIMMTVRKQG